MSVVSAEESHHGAPAEEPRQGTQPKHPTPEGWLLGIARDLGRVVRWAHLEASAVSASAKAAAATTSEVTRGMLRRRGRLEPASIGPLLQRLDELLEDNRPEGYEALRNDERLWRLLDELQTWRERAVSAAELASVMGAGASGLEEDPPAPAQDDDGEPAIDAAVGEPE